MGHKFTAEAEILIMNSGTIGAMEDVKYLGSCLHDPFEDFDCRRAQAFETMRRMKDIWKADVAIGVKLRCLCACIEFILLCGLEEWLTTKTFGKRMNGTYIRLLRQALDVSSMQKKTNEELCYHCSDKTTALNPQTGIFTRD